MKQIKQNAFWASMIGIGVVIVAVFGIFVVPLYSRQTDLQRQVRNLVTDLHGCSIPGEPDIEKWKVYRAQAVEAYEKITKYYADSSKYLQRWFPKFAQDPVRDDFMGTYREQIAALEKEVKDKDTKIGILEEGDEKEKKPTFGFNWEQPQIDDWNKVNQGGTNLPEEKRVLRDLQKRFWARQRVANAILTIANSGGKVTRVIDFRFFKHLHERIQNPPWELPLPVDHTVHYMGAGADLASRAGFAEYSLPNDLGQTMTFGFALELPYSQVPKVISEVLNPGAEANASQRLLVNVVGTHVTIHDQTEPERRFKYPKGNEQERKDKEALLKAELKPLDVILTVTCQIIDVDPAKVKAFNK